MADIQQTVKSLQTLQTQANENDLVLKELELMTDTCQVFKVRGVGLTLVEKDEAIANVQKRLDYINKETGRVEATIKQYQKEQQKNK